jgi:hypothetical protein
MKLQKKNQMHNSEGNLSLRPDLMMDGARIICKKKSFLDGRYINFVGI